ncbi:mandelate racemase/muconate lactonizing enzyme family protein [Streptomyces edwardsiae]|uniref:Mandelate racemase/muconate lactonizing enzyme family protein n=1 Tax=Streptomyces edwardsiae TaxID=3075527 RepID=A0ABU2QD29_9ACTN|nr:mandelate racemase/muconate lactonizing enzyme family protein [Streptomyces sp. DSM 41635]MDT0401405.1 mandelate racemase/muconate lactonizing enzyme family protein [Streptomyces sp. DSM 41635]
MKITGYRSLRTVHQWGRPVGDANGVVTGGVTEVPVLLVETDGGLTGVGLGTHTDAARVFPAVEGQDPRAVTALYDRMLAHTFKSGHSGSVFGTIGAFDMALWDLKAKMAGEPLWRTLGAADRFVPGYASGLDIALGDEELVALYSGWAGRGFTGAKIKGGLDTDRDIGRLEAVADVLRGNTRSPALMLDVNETWGRHQAVRLLARIENRVELAWIEEPVRRWDVRGNRAVARAGRTPVATGENLTGLEQFRPLLAADALQVVQTAGVWGITHFLRVATLAHGHDLPVSPVGYHANPLAHAAAAVPNHLATEVQDTGMPVGITVDQVLADGGIVLGDTPGLGISVDEPAFAGPDADAGWTRPDGPHVRPRSAGLRLTPETGATHRPSPIGRTERESTP